MTTTHESIARQRKVFALASAIEKLAGTDDPTELLTCAEDLSDADWVTLAEVAKVRAPSEQTVGLILHFFAERKRWSEDPFAGLPYDTRSEERGER